MKKPFHSFKPHGCLARRGFTLIEMLVSVTIIAILAGLAGAGTSAAMAKARTVREMNAARNLITAYTSATTNGGDLLPCYDEKAAPQEMPDGSVLTGQPIERYPYRLAEYLNYEIEGTFLVNDNHEVVKGLAADSSTYHYNVSLSPALGMNGYGVGGYFKDNNPYAAEMLIRAEQSDRSGGLIVFASARGRIGSKTVAGNFYVTPPNMQGKRWNGGKFDENADPSRWGNVDFRHNGRAICAFLDGSVRLLNEDELRDMRRWSKNAAAEDKANYLMVK